MLTSFWLPTLNRANQKRLLCGAKDQTTSRCLKSVPKNLNKKSLEALIKCGAMDMFGDRGVMLKNLPDLLEYNKEQGAMHENQETLFGAFGGASGGSATDASAAKAARVSAGAIGGYGEHLRLIEEGHARQSEKLVWEKELLGLYISGHPLDRFKAILEKRDMSIAKVREVIEKDAEEFAKKMEGKMQNDAMKAMAEEAKNAALGISPEKAAEMKAAAEAKKAAEPKEKKRFNKEEFIRNKKLTEPRERDVVVAGIIEEAKEIATKKDATVKMMFLKIADFTGTIEAVVFPKTYEVIKGVLLPEACIALKGKTSNRNGVPSIIVDTVKLLS